MPSSSISLLFLAGVMLCFGGCATAERASLRPLAVAVAITPIGTSSLSAEQVTRVHAALGPEIQRAGYTLAQSSAAADLVLIVNFTPTPGGGGGRVKITGLEPTAQFRQATAGGDTPEAKEMRLRQREIELWIERQHRSYEY
jgi:hypothetical protein